MNHSCSKANEQTPFHKENKPIKKLNPDAAYPVPVRKSNSQVIKKDLKSIISNLKNEIIHISLDRTGKNPTKPNKPLNDNDSSFNGKHLSSTHNNIMTDMNYTNSPLRRKSNENFYNELLIKYNKLNQESASLRNSRSNQQVNSTNNPTLSLQSKPQNSKLDDNASVTVIESNEKGIKRSAIKQAENSKKTFQSKRDTYKKSKVVPSSALKNGNGNSSNNQIREYQKEIMKLKDDNKALKNKCNEFNERMIMLLKEKKEYETLISNKDNIIEKQTKVIETLTTQNSIQFSNVQTNEKLNEEIV